MSIAEALTMGSFEIEEKMARFLPGTMAHGHVYPAWVPRLYLAMPTFWPFIGKQLLVVGRKPS